MGWGRRRSKFRMRLREWSRPIQENGQSSSLILGTVTDVSTNRPTAESVLLHPFFWNAQKRLLFICDASDRFEIMEREPPTATLVSLEDTSELVVGEDWSKSIDRSLLDNLGKYRKYDGKSVRDLLRVLRNKVSLPQHSSNRRLTLRAETSLSRFTGQRTSESRRFAGWILIVLHDAVSETVAACVRCGVDPSQRRSDVCVDFRAA